MPKKRSRASRRRSSASPTWAGEGEEGSAPAALAASLFFPGCFRPDPAWFAVVLCGAPIAAEAAEGLFTRFNIRADVLVTIALAASVATGEIFAAGEVALIMQLGSLLEDKTAARARAGTERLVRLTPRTARIVSDGAEKVIPASEVRLGDRLRVLPGETVPVDGVIVSGSASVDEPVMTGEPIPVDKAAGSEVTSGTTNQFGSFVIKACRVGEDSSIQRMVRLVQSADAGRARIVRLADRWATWVVAALLALAAAVWFSTGEFMRSVMVLVVFCPCAFVLATPTAVMAAIGNATRHGFLVRMGDALEKLAAVKRFAFDKTGTLTRGVPEIASVRVFGRFPQKELYRLAAALEAASEHPLGRAVARNWTDGDRGACRTC